MFGKKNTVFRNIKNKKQKKTLLKYLIMSLTI